MVVSKIFYSPINRNNIYILLSNTHHIFIRYAPYRHPLHLDNLSVTNNILATALLCGQYEIGIQCLLRAIDVYNCIYRYNHPIIGLKCLSLGSLFQSIGDNENATKYLQMGKDALSITHGKDSEIVKDAIALLQTIM